MVDQQVKQPACDARVDDPERGQGQDAAGGWYLPGQVHSSGCQEGHAADGGHERGDSHGWDVGEPAPVDQRGACIAQRAEQHGSGAEKLHGVAPEVDA